MKSLVSICLTFFFCAVSSADRVPVTTGRYVTGGVLGSALGFGIGHGVQGRYLDKGWIFTAAEIGGLVLLGQARCGPKASDDRDIYRPACESNAAAFIGLGTFIGFRVWETVDVWVGARPESEEAKLSIMVVPSHNGPQLAASLTF